MWIHTNRISDVPSKRTAVNRAVASLPIETNARSRSVMIARRIAVLVPILNRTPIRSSTPTTTSTDRSSMPLNKLMIIKSKNP
jgi:hypothetical protein